MAHNTISTEDTKAALWGRLARRYEKEALHWRNMGNEIKAVAYDTRAAEAAAKAIPSPPC